MAVISIIVPCYNEEASLPIFLPEIKKVADHMSAAYSVNLDILFINDGSKDNTLAVLRDAAAHSEKEGTPVGTESIKKCVCRRAGA